MRAFGGLLLLAACSAPPSAPGPGVGATNPSATISSALSPGPTGPTGEPGPTGPAGVGAPGSDGTKDGTRLRVRKMVSADGAELGQSFYDTNRHEDCQFMLMSDGKLHCVPWARASGLQATRYADDQCQQRVAMVAKATCPRGYAYSSESSAVCSQDYVLRLYSIGETLTAPATFWLKNGVACVSEGANHASYDYYSVSELAPALFVEGAWSD